MKNKKRIRISFNLSIMVLSFSTIFLFLSNSASAKVTNVDIASSFSEAGTQADPYLIENLTDLLYLSYHTNGTTVGNYKYVQSNFTGKYFKLTTNINMNDLPTGTNFIPIKDFQGIFNGNYHIISNLNITATADNIGLFGTISGATIENLGLVGGTITATGKNNVGALVGLISGTSTVTNCYAIGLTITGNDNVGGLIGHINNITGNAVSYVYANNNVTVTKNKDGKIGGIIGVEDGTNTTINNAYYPETITITGTKVNNSTLGIQLTTGTGTNSISDFESNPSTYLTSGVFSSAPSSTVNNGYPVFGVTYLSNTDGISTDITIPSGFTDQITSPIIINDGGSLVDNRTTGNIYNGTTQVTLKKNLYVNKWNLFGISQITQTSVTGVLNNNAGTTSNLIHDMVAVKYNYDNNSWNTTYLGAIADNTFYVGDGYFVWPLINIININEGTVNNTETTNTEQYTAVSQTGVPTNADVSFSKQNQGTIAVIGLHFQILILEDWI